MRYLDGIEYVQATKHILLAAMFAKQSKCLRSRCGSVIVNNGEVIGRGWNSPPGDIKPARCIKDLLPAGFKSDRHCCVHAEQRAIKDALERNPGRVKGARLYFIRLDDQGTIKRSGKPYCTQCSKEALDNGLAEFVLYHDQGICVYDTKEYNELSFAYRPEQEAAK